MEYGKMERKAEEGGDSSVQLVLDLKVEPMADDDDEGGDGGADD